MASATVATTKNSRSATRSVPPPRPVRRYRASRRCWKDGPSSLMPHPSNKTASGRFDTPRDRDVYWAHVRLQYSQRARPVTAGAPDPGNRMPGDDDLLDIANLLQGLAGMLPAAQKYLDHSCAVDTARALSTLGNPEGPPELTRALLPGHHVIHRQTIEMSCHLSTRRDTSVSVGASLRLTPVSAEIFLRHDRVLDHACRIEVTTERVD